MEQSGGFFLTGKLFDQLERHENYYPIVQAFTGFVHMVLERNQETVQAVKNEISELVETDRMLTGIIPALEQIVDTQSPLPEKKGAESQKRCKFPNLDERKASPYHPNSHSSHPEPASSNIFILQVCQGDLFSGTSVGTLPGRLTVGGACITGALVCSG